MICTSLNTYDNLTSIQVELQEYASPYLYINHRITYRHSSIVGQIFINYGFNTVHGMNTIAHRGYYSIKNLLRILNNPFRYLKDPAYRDVSKYLISNQKVLIVMYLDVIGFGDEIDLYRSCPRTHPSIYKFFYSNEKKLERILNEKT